MTVESVTYISDLDKTYPAESEVGTLHEGNDHLRNIKKALKNTFPSVTGAVTATQGELNALDGLTATAAELNYNDITTLGTMQASKSLTASSGNVLTVPSGGAVTFASGSTLTIAGDVSASGKTLSPAELGTLDGITTTSTIAEQLQALWDAIEEIQDDITALEAGMPTVDLKFGIQFNLEEGANEDFTLDQYATFAYTIDSAVYKTASGSITANVKIDGTSVTGLSALSITNTEGGPTSASAAKTVSIGQTVSVTLSSNSSAEKVVLKLNCTRD